jgi:ribosomal protein S18 acetylase RimI-like enzyme
MSHPAGCTSFVIREGADAMDFARVHAWLASSYWSPGVSRERVETGARNSALVFGAFDATSGAQCGYTRVVSDKVRFAYLCDVWVDQAWRGRGIARALLRHAMAHPDMKAVTTWTLGTRDAMPLYESLGFRDIREPGVYANTFMMLRKP